MNAATAQLQRLLAALGDPSRFRIVLELAARERHVSELAVAVGLSQSCTTRHLQALERAGAVHARRAGKRVMAALALEQDAVARLLGLVRDAAGLDAYAAPAAAPAAPPRARRRATGRGPEGTRRPGRDARSGAVSRAVSQVRTPAARGASGTSPAPVADPPPAPTRSRSDLDDFLL